MKLSTEQHDEIFRVVKSSFSDFTLFDALVAGKLRQCLKESNFIEINEKTTKRVVERYFRIEEFKTVEQKALIYPLELIFQSAYVLVISHREAMKAMQWESVSTLIAHYPQFATDVDEEELKYLLNYRNILKIALTIIPARLNKGRLLQIAGKLEGSRSEYITGSGQKIEVVRRVEIYHGESKIKLPVKRPRKPKQNVAVTPAAAVPSYHDAHSLCVVTSEDGGANSDVCDTNIESTSNASMVSVAPAAASEVKKKRKGCGPLVCTSSSFSNSKLKMMRIAAEDVQRLLQRGGSGHKDAASTSMPPPYAPLLPLPSPTDARQAPPTKRQRVASATTVATTIAPHVIPSYSPSPGLVDLPYPWALDRHVFSAGRCSMEAATVSVWPTGDCWDTATGGDGGGGMDYFGLPGSQPPSIYSVPVSPPPQPRLARDTTLEEFIRGSGLLSPMSSTVATGSLWGDFNETTLYGSAEPPPGPSIKDKEQLPDDLSPGFFSELPQEQQQSGVVSANVSSILSRPAGLQSSIPLDLFSDLLSGEDIFSC